MNSFGNVLSELMVEENTTSKTLAEKISVSEATVSTWKSNTHGIQLSHLVALCKHFGCSLEYLVGRTEQDIKPTKFEIKNFGTLVRQMMKTKGISTYKMRKETQYGSRYFERWDKGADPKLSTLIELGNYFNCSLDDLVGFE